MSTKDTVRSRCYNCNHCDLSFTRREHLERHLMRHSGAKSFTCDHCSKPFARKDALRRHLIVHGVRIDDLSDTQRKNCNRACVSCARQKKRCTGGIPCDACAQRNTSCTTRSSEQSHGLVESLRICSGYGTSSPVPSPSDGTEPAQNRGLDVASNTVNPEFQLPLLPTINADLNTGIGLDYHDYHGLAMQNGLASLDEWLWADIDGEAAGGLLNSIPEIDMAASMANQSLYDTSKLNPLQDSRLDRCNIPYEPTARLPDHIRAGPQQTPPWPSLSDDDVRVLATEDFAEAPHMPAPVLSCVLRFCEAHYHLADRDHVEAVLRAFVEVYFRHFAPQYPFLHPSNLYSSNVSWVLLLVVAMIGSQYSRIRHALNFTEVLRNLAQKAIEQNFPLSLQSDSLPWAQIRLLYDINLLWAGSRDSQVIQQLEKNILISICRALKMEAGGIQGSGVNGGVFEDTQTSLTSIDFNRWVILESRIRLFHQVYRHECLQFVFLDIRPSMDLSEFTELLPCDAALWNCRNESEWWITVVNQRAEIPGSLRFNCQGRRDHICNTDREVQYLHAYVEERLAFDVVRKFRRRRGLLASIAYTNPNTVTGRRNGKSDPAKLLESIAACTEEMLTTFLSTSALSDPTDAVGNYDALHLVLRMLRIMPLRTLYALSSWQATGPQTIAARSIFQDFMQSQPAISRQGLVFALVAFVSLRSKEHFEPHDPLCALAAILYIWAYDSLSDPPLPGPPVQGSGGIVLRFEHRTQTGPCADWLEAGGSARIYLERVGFLDGKTSPSRILHGLSSLIQARTEWRGLCMGLAKTIQQLINGQRPGFED